MKFVSFPICASRQSQIYVTQSGLYGSCVLIRRSLYTDINCLGTSGVFHGSNPIAASCERPM
jgi:hypothetical protein